MCWTRLRLDLPPEPTELATRLADRPGLTLLGPGFGSGAWYLGCDPEQTVVGWDPEPLLGLTPHAHAWARAPRWVGLLPYEATRWLERPGRGRTPDTRTEPHGVEPRWSRYSAMVRIGDDVSVVGQDPVSAERLARLIERPPTRASCSLGWAEPSEDPEIHGHRVRSALELIAQGELYQVNLARRLSFRLEGSPLELWRALWRRAAAPYAVYLDAGDLIVAGVSPELFLALDRHGELVTEPIKGSRPRAGEPLADLELARALERDPKEQAELSMVIDVERNDLGRVSVTGSVALDGPPAVRSFPAIHHRVARIRATLRPEVSRTELLAAMLPSGSVTGAPKIRAMESIAQLEAERRGLYTGAVGTLGHDGTLTLGMVIRTATIRRDEVHYFAGGGIVADSDPARETEETAWKAAQLVGLARPSGA
jgi:anthranilate/para-aminobenzoate synthase component I